MFRHWCSEQQNAKLLVKWKDLLFGQWKGPDPLTSGRGGAYIFSTGCRFINLDPGQADSSCRSPPGTWFLHCRDHKKQKGNSSAATAAWNSCVPGAAGGASLTDGTHYAVPAGRRGKINIEIRRDWQSCCRANSEQKIILLILFWLDYPLLMFFFSPMIPENLMYKWT